MSKYYIPIKMIISSGFLIIASIGFFNKQISIETAIVFVALIFCWIGDLLLALSDEVNNLKKNPQFIMGTGSFLIAQILFCVRLLQIIDGDYKFTMLITLGLPAFMLLMIKKERFKCDMNIWPALGYSAFIGGFCGLGLNYLLIYGISFETVKLGVGACMFFTSDVILSFKCFGDVNGKWVIPAVLTTYYSATYLIALSI